MKAIGQLLPVDGYHIVLKEPLPTNYLQSFTHLYQPLIGSEALMLYQTLLNDMELQGDNVPQTHHTLMNYLMLPLDKIYESRVKLEGMGLLKTYKKVVQGTNVYTYELQRPYDPKSFFQEAMFTTLLYHHIGEQKFRKLQSFYMPQETNHRGENITVDFQEVFQTFTPNKEVIQPVQKDASSEKEKVLEEEYQWLEHMLRQQMIPVAHVLTTENRKLISQMLQLYDLETFEIEKAVLWALTDENALDIGEFKQACHDLFIAKNNNKPIRLTEKLINQQPEVQKDKPKTKEEALIQQLEIISPKQLLEDLSSGGFASEQDMKLIRDIMTTQGLPAPVMNVLIYYVLLQTNMKLTKGYLGKIAGQWSRAKLTSAKEAMEFAKQEKASYANAKEKRTNRYQKTIKQGVVPDWFQQGQHLQAKPEEEKRQEMTENQIKIANLIKRYSEGN